MDEQAKINRLRTVIDRPLRHMVSTGVTPGVSYAVLSGETTHRAYFGNAMTAPITQPLRPNQYYDMASLTKVMGTTPLFLRAAKDGLLELDQEVRTILPAFSGDDVTFRELLTHTSGLEGYIPHRDELSAPDLQVALTTQLHVGPERDKVAVYRDFNLLLAGWALEKVYGGVPVQELITREILRPWGMDATFAPTKALSVPTTYTPQAGLRCGVVHDHKAAILGAHSGAAGMFATLAGVVRFIQIAFGANQGVLSPTWAQALQRDYSLGYAKRSVGFDLRWQPGQSLPWLYHTGYTGTFMLFDPTAKLGIVVLANRVHPYVHPGFLGQRDAIVHRVLREVATWE